MEPRKSDTTRQLESAYELLVAGHHQEAIIYLDEVLFVDTDNVWALATKGQALRQLSRFDESAVYYEQALRVSREYRETEGILPPVIFSDSQILQELGTVYWLRSRTSGDKTLLTKATEATQQSLQLQPRNSDAWHTLGICKWELGRRSEGLAAIEKSIECNPNRVEAYITLFHYQIYSWQLRAAVRTYLTARRLLLRRIS